jgi:hypothetical protein
MVDGWWGLVAWVPISEGYGRAQSPKGIAPNGDLAAAPQDIPRCARLGRDSVPQPGGFLCFAKESHQRKATRRPRPASRGALRASQLGAGARTRPMGSNSLPRTTPQAAAVLDEADGTEALYCGRHCEFNLGNYGVPIFPWWRRASQLKPDEGEGCLRPAGPSSRAADLGEKRRVPGEAGRHRGRAFFADFLGIM